MHNVEWVQFANLILAIIIILQVDIFQFVAAIQLYARACVFLFSELLLRFKSVYNANVYLLAFHRQIC